MGGFTSDIKSIYWPETCTLVTLELPICGAQLAQAGMSVVDVMMPGMTGPQTLAALRVIPRLADIPAIFLTASQHEGKGSELLATGAIAVLEKPFDPLTLGHQIKALLEGQ